MVHTVVQYVVVGGFVTFDCHAEGDPPPVVTWVKVDGELPITATREGGLLTVPNVQLTDAGTYRCTATNTVGSQTSQVILFVQCKWMFFFFVIYNYTNTNKICFLQF